MQQPLVLVVHHNFRARSISVLQEQLLFEGEKMILGLADGEESLEEKPGDGAQG